MNFEDILSFEFNSPMTKEDWDKLQDCEMEDTEEVTFKTPSGKSVQFRKVKHGEWERIESDTSVDFQCSVCHRYRFHNQKMLRRYKFCPNCGADMRGDRDEI